MITSFAHLAAIVDDSHFLHVARLVVVERLEGLDVPELQAISSSD